MKHIAVFASGSGTNAENIIRYFSTRKNVKVTSVFVNNPHAGVIERVKGSGTEIVLFDRAGLYDTRFVTGKLAELNTDLIVLAGFLWHLPALITGAYEGRIVNIHPALLPAFGGKGMYGDRVHRAVIESGSDISGITIHYVNEIYDAGDIIFQAECPVLPGDTPEVLAARVHALEYIHYPVIIEELLSKL